MILFRCDSSNVIGTGHIIRCLRLAAIIKKIGHEVSFFCLDLTGNISQFILQAGFSLQILESESEIIEQMRKVSPEWVVVDHYNLDRKWEESLGPETKIFVVDDLANREHNCDVLLDQNYRKNYNLYSNKVSRETRLLLGPNFCLLDEALHRGNTKYEIQKVPQIVCFFGGIDATGELLKLMEQIPGNSVFQYHLVCLGSHLYLNSLLSFKRHPNTTLHVNNTHWKNLLGSADFYIGSGGTVTWERLFLGIPGAVITVAENQIGPTKDLAEDGYQFYWGHTGQIDYSSIDSQLIQLFSDSEFLYKMSSKSIGLVKKFNFDLAKEIFGLP